MAGGFQVGPETFVTLSFQVFDAEGEATSDPETMGFVFGLGGILPQVSSAIEGRASGETVEVSIRAEQAYGKRDPKAVLEVDRSEFPENVSVGDRFEVENADGGLLVVHILDVQDDVVVMDTNHPLADQDIQVKATILEVRPADPEEIEAAMSLLQDDEEVLKAEVPDISPQNLVRGRS